MGKILDTLVLIVKKIVLDRVSEMKTEDKETIETMIEATGSRNYAEEPHVF